MAADHGVFWRCPACGGRAVGVGLLRKSISPAFLTRLWVAAREGHAIRQRLCPMCAKQMLEVPPPDEARGPTLDVCRVCQLVWFDPGEYEAMPLLPHPPTPELPLALRESLATLEAAEIAEAGRQTGQTDAPDEWWKYIARFFGLPIKYDADPPTRPPWATWGLAIVITVVSAVAFFRLDQAVASFGLIPAQASRYGGLTLLTAFFFARQRLPPRREPVLLTDLRR